MKNSTNIENRRRKLCHLLYLAIIAGLLGLAGPAQAETIAEFDTTRFFIIDSLLTGGEIARPKICPVDSTWIAYEIHTNGTIQLFLHNISSGERRRINPEAMTDDSTVNDSLFLRINYDLAWCPVSLEGKIWAAYVSDSGGLQDIYFYEIASGNHYCLFCNDDPTAEPRYTIRGVPDWSIDGRCLAYTAEAYGDPDIYIVRKVDKLLENPKTSGLHQSKTPLIVEEGLQFDPVWCPVEGAGYLAYTDQEKPDAWLRIKVLDLTSGKSFQLTTIDTTVDYFAPKWNPTGNRIAYYRHNDDDGPMTRFSGPDYGHLEIGLATVQILEDSLVLTPEKGGIAGQEGIVEVLPNYDRLLGPAWLPGGRHLVINTIDEPRPTRLCVVSLDDWEAGEIEDEYWLRGFGGDRFDYPSDLNIVNRNISFTYELALRKYLLAGQIVPSIRMVLIQDQIEIAANRRHWWQDYAGSDRSGTGFLAKVGHFLWSPIVGPDIFINKGIVAVAGGMTLLMVLSGNDSGTGVTPDHRDWTPPDFPEAHKAPGINIRIGF